MLISNNRRFTISRGAFVTVEEALPQDTIQKYGGCPLERLTCLQGCNAFTKLTAQFRRVAAAMPSITSLPST